MACSLPSLDRHGRQQCVDAARLYAPHAHNLARGYRPRVIPRRRLRAGQHLGGARMCIPQYLSGALAVFCRQHRHGLCAGQDDAVLPGPLERVGGIRALALEVAEDAAATKLVRKNDLRVRVVDRPFSQPLGHRTAAEVWRRQLRWARLRRDTFRLYFVPEIAAGGIPPLAACSIVVASTDWPVAGALTAFGAIWYSAE